MNRWTVTMDPRRDATRILMMEGCEERLRAVLGPSASARPGGLDAARGPGAVAAATALRCSLCGYRGDLRLHGSSRTRSAWAVRNLHFDGGDDSPVCRLSPLAGMAAACAHHNPAERLTPLQALTMYTCDAARFGHAEGHTGRLAPGYDADLAVLDRDPFAGAPFAATHVLETWRAGEPVYRRHERGPAPRSRRAYMIEMVGRGS